jgi:hypothetical protein
MPQLRGNEPILGLNSYSLHEHFDYIIVYMINLLLIDSELLKILVKILQYTFGGWTIKHGIFFNK